MYKFRSFIHEFDNTIFRGFLVEYFVHTSFKEFHFDYFDSSFKVLCVKNNHFEIEIIMYIVLLAVFIFRSYEILMHHTYAIDNCSFWVAAPLRFKLKTIFCIIYVLISRSKFWILNRNHSGLWRRYGSL